MLLEIRQADIAHQPAREPVVSAVNAIAHGANVVGVVVRATPTRFEYLSVTGVKEVGT